MIDTKAIYGEWKRRYRPPQLILKYPSFVHLVEWFEKECKIRGADVFLFDIRILVDPTLDYHENKDRLEDELNKVAPIEEEVNLVAHYEKEIVVLEGKIKKLENRTSPNFKKNQPVSHKKFGSGTVKEFRLNKERCIFEYLAEFGEKKVWISEEELWAVFKPSMPITITPKQCSDSPTTFKGLETCPAHQNRIEDFLAQKETRSRFQENRILMQNRIVRGLTIKEKMALREVAKNDPGGSIVPDLAKALGWARNVTQHRYARLGGKGWIAREIEENTHRIKLTDFARCHAELWAVPPSSPSEYSRPEPQSWNFTFFFQPTYIQDPY